MLLLSLLTLLLSSLRVFFSNPSDYGVLFERRRQLLLHDNVSEVCFPDLTFEYAIDHVSTAVYPRTYDPSFAIGACILAIVFASTFALIFPLIAPAVVILLLLTLIGMSILIVADKQLLTHFRLAHRFLVGYVYARTHSQTGGLLQLWLLRRFGTLLSFQPILLGLIFLSRHFWIEGGVLIGTGVFVILFVEIYTSAKMRQPGRKSLSPITRNSLERFQTGADRRGGSETDTVSGSSVPGTRTRGSMASVLEMMSLTLAVMPTSSNYKGPVPLREFP